MEKKTKENYSATPYDDAFRTMLNDCPQLIIPVVNEVFQQTYDNHEIVTVLNNEFFLSREGGALQERITDTNFRIGDTRYHLECQSNQDGTMLYRLFEYDSQLALQDGVMDGNHLEVPFPRTAVVYLRHTKSTPDTMKITIRANEASCTYEVPILKVQTYSLEEIFEKNLLFLIPFHIFSYEKDFALYESKEEKLEELQTIYQNILQHLNKLEQEGKLDTYSKQTIVDMSKNVIQFLASKQEHVKEGLGDVMGGKILDHEAKDILNQGKALGRSEGIELGRSEGIVSLIESFQEIGRDKKEVIQKLMEKYKLSKEEAEAKVTEHWQ